MCSRSQCGACIKVLRVLAPPPSSTSCTPSASTDHPCPVFSRSVPDAVVLTGAHICLRAPMPHQRRAFCSPPHAACTDARARSRAPRRRLEKSARPAAHEDDPQPAAGGGETIHRRPKCCNKVSVPSYPIFCPSAPNETILSHILPMGTPRVRFKWPPQMISHHCHSHCLTA
jgi:hypothetical protein